MSFGATAEAEFGAWVITFVAKVGSEEMETSVVEGSISI